jgi:protein SCO1/2
MWRQVYDALGDDADRVRFVFITVDPQRDTPERLKVHLQAFNPKFIGLTGSPEELEKAYQAFGVFQEKDTTSETAAGYLVTHTASSFLVDPEGQWRERLSYGTPVEDIVHDVRAVLE